MRNRRELRFRNRRDARMIWPGLSSMALRRLDDLTDQHSFSVAAGDLSLLEGNWYVTHSGLLRVARLNRCAGIHAQPVREFCGISDSRWMFRAIVYTGRRSKGFVGHGDADPSNVSIFVRGSEARVAETRAINRALRKAYAIGLCSVEELGLYPSTPRSRAALPKSDVTHSSNAASNDHPRLRDQLCLLIRQHNLDPSLVKAYAADFCGTTTLKDASRELVESFITQLATAAKNDRDALICKLNSYAQPAEAKP